MVIGRNPNDKNRDNNTIRDMDNQFLIMVIKLQLNL